MPASRLEIPTEAQPRSFLNGMVHEDVVSTFNMPQAAVSLSLNGNFDKIGAWQSRKGITALGNQMNANKSVVGLYNFRDAGAGTNNQLIAVNSDKLYYLSGSTWTNIRSGLTDSAKSRFTTFVDYVFHANGNESTLTWDGNAAGSFGTVNASGAPTAKFADTFKQKVYLAANDTNPDRLWFSSAPNSTNNVTWSTGAGGQWIDISPQDGENLTGIKRFAKEMLCFKPNALYRYYGVSGTDPDPIYKVGTQSQESVVEGKDGVYFHHPDSDSIQKYDGRSPIEISLPIKPFLQAVPLSYYDDVAGWADRDHVYEAIGDVTVSGVTFSNVVVRYTISSRVWTVYSYGVELVIGTPYNDGTTQQVVVGNTDGKVYQFDTGNTDDGTAIACKLVTDWYEWGGVATHKVISKLAAICSKAKGIKVGWQADDNTNVYPLGECNKFLTVFRDKSIKGHRIRFVVTASMTTAPFTFEGFEILEAINEGIIS